MASLGCAQSLRFPEGLKGSTWQPDQVLLSVDKLRTEDWQLHPDDRWHGFAGLKPGQAILDPIKVTLLCPGLDAAEGEVGIPAAVVSKFLWERGLTVEKTGVYSVLVLFSIGITKGKWSTLLTELIRFKRLYDTNAPLEVALRSVAPRYVGCKWGLRDLCREIHESYQANDLMQAIQKMYLTLPGPPPSCSMYPKPFSEPYKLIVPIGQDNRNTHTTLLNKGLICSASRRFPHCSGAGVSAACL